jgi:hypothetical protein
VIDDGKALYAFDRAAGQSLQPITDYFLAAIETVTTNKQRYAQAEARARANRPPRPPWFDVSRLQENDPPQDHHQRRAVVGIRYDVNRRCLL